MIKVSVIIPTYNRPTSLQAAVQSVLDQDVEGLEIIIIDDASEEKYQDQIAAIAASNAVVELILNKENKGVSACRNVGLSRSRGAFVLFLDDDDTLLPEMFKCALKAFENSSLDLVSCRSKVISVNLSERQLKRYNAQQKDKLNLYSMASHPAEHIFLYTPQIHTFLVRRSSINGIQFPEHLNYGEDMIFWLTLVTQGVKCKKLDFVGCRYNFHDNSASAKANFQSKMACYHRVLAEAKSNSTIRNLCYIKMAYLTLSNRDLHFFKWVMRALRRPSLLIKHVWYYI
ncbi:Glycosyltransferase involved in cell wall bisynthesis [Reichenbachiella faecimaris]|uniref:Glycosyltransferase involved in cell wall bisynthesis n=1 Tax=Reichenbachiella faecimaris TaxID=692418 RepID=A0A1W2G968_REIFA|nr:glycosyltransferase [Reichenbachiella faecimaris]SMD33044.1 Glycosyltransferase involved in cell wall bisynthesis [Reichenbachiella faecimaris]